MKLSVLKELVAEIEEHTISTNTDPDISFWVHRVERLHEAGPDDSNCFVNFDIDMAHPISEHIVCHSVPSVVHSRGDFCVPLIVTPFFKR